MTGFEPGFSVIETNCATTTAETLCYFVCVPATLLQSHPIKVDQTECQHQCDQIGRFIRLWATFQRLCATINLPKSPTFLSNFCNGVKIFNYSSEIIFGQLLQRFGDLFLVTLLPPQYSTACHGMISSVSGTTKLKCCHSVCSSVVKVT